jgi:RimJ/RimL family protein N-acetyltransferase
MTAIAPVTLSDARVTLAPLSQDHAEGLAQAAADGALDRLWYTSVPSPEHMAAEIDRRLGLQAAGSMIPFAVRAPDGRAVGMTTYMHIDRAAPRVEIGSTWLAASVQRTGLNTAMKRLMLAQAFDAWGCLAVEFRTHRLNRQSRTAIERLGAQLDGILRAHMRLPDGTVRDTAVYSITAPEWPMIRVHLDALLARSA